MKERPLINVELNQGYIHYQKGSVALYYLAEMIGEDRINVALKEVIDQFAYQGPPYPTAHALVDRLRDQTLPEFQYLIQDLFEEITLFGNRSMEAVATKSPDGKYRVKLVVECEKFKADENGHETSVEMNDWVEIGAFAKPESGKRYGKLLHRERKQLTAGKHELEFVTDEIPYQAGIDPRNMLIDRVPSDNLKTVTIKN
jgi:ABC-2 type transport system permease protein